MRLLTRAEACREPRLSLSTLNRRIASGEVPVRREPRGRQQRVYVMLDDDPPENGEVHGTGETALVVALERIRGLKEQVDILEGQLHSERERYGRLLEEVKTARLPFPFPSKERRRTWWNLWKR